MTKQLQTVGANYLVARKDNEITKDIGKVMMVGGGGGLVTLGVLSMIPFLPVLLIVLLLGGFVTYVRGAVKD